MKPSDNYPTPKWLLDVFDGWYDPCPLNPTFDGLKTEWEQRTYVNPPYSEPLKWVEKAIEESKKGKTVVMLMRVDTSTKWFAKLVEADAEFLWFHRRVKFTDSAPNFASMLVILKSKISKGDIK